MSQNNVQLVITGSLMMWAGPTAPGGWRECDGSAISRTDYQQLFNIIGTSYGAGDGTTTFNLPDLRGEFVRGWDNGRGVDPGRQLGTNQDSANKSHTHGISDPGHRHSVNVLSDANTPGVDGPGDNNDGSNVDKNTTTVTTGISINSAGGSEARPRNVTVMYIIKI